MSILCWQTKRLLTLQEDGLFSFSHLLDVVVQSPLVGHNSASGHYTPKLVNLHRDGSFLVASQLTSCDRMGDERTDPVDCAQMQSSSDEAKLGYSMSTCSSSQSASFPSEEECFHEILLDHDEADKDSTPDLDDSFTTSWDDTAGTDATLRVRDDATVEQSVELSKLEAVFNRIHNLFPDTSLGFLPVKLPTVHRNDLVTGGRLGRGCFSDVFEIHKIKGHQGEEQSQPTAYGETQYALKCLREDARDDPINAWTNFADLVVESRLLSQLVHPNIINLRAVADKDALCPNYFIILDKLYDTLGTRMKKWKQDETKIKKGLNRFGWKPRDAKKCLWEKRLVLARCLPSALDYMHKQRVIHRDLKPENIGFDVVSKIRTINSRHNYRNSSTLNF